jgi:pimeloyl-ACP methyl ester carboxylesterase
MFVLVHGAYHAGWCFSPLVEQLEARGHAALAPDLPGHAFNDGWIGQQEMPSYINAIVELIDGMGTPPTLLGHSMSGAVVAAVAEQRPEKLAQVIFLAAYIPANGECLADLAKADTQSHVRAELMDIGGVTAISLKSGVLADAFYHDATSRQLGWVQDRIQLQAAGTFREKITLSDKNFGRVRKSAIVCTKDRAISVGHERWMAERAGCDPVIEIDTGHSPFVTAPELLADTLIGL